MPRLISAIAITGASSGIGTALALAYAGPGVTLGLFGRDPDRLAMIASAARQRGASAATFEVDVTDRAGMEAALRTFDRERPIDLLIAAAGVSSGAPPGGELEPAESAHAVFDINVLGTANTVLPALELMAARGEGRIVLVGSLAARPPLPFSPAYSASKAAVESYGEALRGAARPFGVVVTVVSPGFVETPMSARVVGPRPFMMTAERAAMIIQAAVAKGRARIAFPWPLAVLTEIAAALPRPLRDFALRFFAFRVRPG